MAATQAQLRDFRSGPEPSTSRDALPDAPAAAIVSGLVSNLNGPGTSTLTVKGPLTFLGSRHESEHVPPQPYSRLKDLS